MAQDLEKLILRLDADLRSYERALAKAQGVTATQMRKIERDVQTSATHVEKSVSRMSGVFKNLGKGLLIGAGIGGISELGRSIQQAVAQAAKIGDLSDKIGVSTNALQALQLGAVQADMSFEDMDKTLLRFSRTLGEAANGQGEYLKTLRANDQQLKGTFLDNLRQLADLVANAKNEQEALLIITQAMGKGSDGWLEVLRQGSDGIRQLGEEARTTGAIVEESLIREAQKLDDQWAALMNNMGTYTKTFAVEAAKVLGGLFSNAQKLSDSLRSGNARQFLFGNEGGLSGAIGNALLGPDQSLAAEDPLMRQPRGTREKIFARPATPTKVSNPEEEAAKKRQLAEADREAKRAKEELTRAIEREFEAFTRSLASIDEDIAAKRLEAETLGLSTGEIERQRIAQELLNEAQRAGIPITRDLNAVIQQKAQAAGDAAQALEDLQDAEARAAEINDSIKDSFKGFLSDIRAGVEPIDALTNALGRLAEKLLELALDRVLDSLLQTSATGGGGLGGVLAGLFHRGGVVGQSGTTRRVSPAAFLGARRIHSGGLASDEVPAILQRGEMVLPKGFRGAGSSIVNVYNQAAGVEIGTRSKRRGDGRSELDVIVRAVNQVITEGRADASMRGRFGARPVGRLR